MQTNLSMANALRAMSCVLILALTAACSQSDPVLQATGCIADSLDSLRAGDHLPNCKDDLNRCRDACVDGDGPSCLSAAHAMQAANESEAVYIGLFHQACLLGEANACTNYAAAIWANKPSPKELVCARRVFDKACASREHYACGMRGRIALSSDSTSERETAKDELERDCNAVGGFPCRVLALHTEKGEFGSYESGSLKSLMDKACRGGDENACGIESKVEDTFH